MPLTTLPADSSGLLGGGIARTERMERQTKTPGVREPELMVFSYPGALAANIESPPWYPFTDGTIQTVRVSLTSNATGTNTIAIRVNGVEIQQFSVTAGNMTAVSGAAIKVGTGSYVTVKTIAVADSNMTVSVSLG